MTENILEVKGLFKKFGKKEVLNNVNFSVQKGEILGFLGPNGAGKTTTIRIMLNALNSNSGNIVFEGNTVKRNEVAYRSNIGYMPENNTPLEFVNAVEYLEFLSGVYGIEKSKRKAKIDELLQIFKLYDERKKLIRDYSKGMKQKILFIGAVFHNPSLLILDEPFTGIEPSTAIMMRDLIHKLKDSGTAIIFSSHILEIVEKLADRVILIDNGEIIGEGIVRELKDRGGLEEFFTVLTKSGNSDENIRRITETIKS